MDDWVGFGKRRIAVREGLEVDALILHWFWEAALVEVLLCRDKLLLACLLLLEYFSSQ